MKTLFYIWMVTTRCGQFVEAFNKTHAVETVVKSNPCYSSWMTVSNFHIINLSEARIPLRVCQAHMDHWTANFLQHVIQRDITTWDRTQIDYISRYMVPEFTYADGLDRIPCEEFQVFLELLQSECPS